MLPPAAVGQARPHRQTSSPSPRAQQHTTPSSPNNNASLTRTVATHSQAPSPMAAVQTAAITTIKIHIIQARATSPVQVSLSLSYYALFVIFFRFLLGVIGRSSIGSYISTPFRFRTRIRISFLFLQVRDRITDCVFHHPLYLLPFTRLASFLKRTSCNTGSRISPLFLHSLSTSSSTSTLACDLYAPHALYAVPTTVICARVSASPFRILGSCGLLHWRPAFGVI